MKWRNEKGEYQSREFIWKVKNEKAGFLIFIQNSNQSRNRELKIRFQFSSVEQSCPTLCDPMNHSTPGLPVHHQLPEFTQTHVHWLSDAIQPSHPLSSPSPPAYNPSQHQSLFQWVNSSHEVAKVLEFSALASFLPKFQGWSPSEWTGWISLQSKGLSRVFSNTTMFKSINSSALSFLHSPTLTLIHDHWKNHSLD